VEGEDLNFLEKYLHLLIMAGICIGFWYFAAMDTKADLQEAAVEKVDLPPVSSVPPMNDFALKHNPFLMNSKNAILVNPTGSAQRKAELGNIYIDGVICSPTQQSVIIGGTVYNQGDKYKGATIVKVTPDKVVLLYNGTLVEKRLNIPAMQLQEGETP